jgi:membrane-associated protein
MEFLQDLLHRVYDVEAIIRWGGLAMICAIVFAETGLMIGFFLPGDSLLVTAGVFAAAGHIDLSTTLWLVSLCAVSGDQLGYCIGQKTGTTLFNRDDSLLFKRSHVLRAQQFYEKYGAKTIVIARFVPIIRTFAPVVAGVGQMPYRRFVAYNVVGGIFWVFSMVLLGYFVAGVVPNIDKQIHKVILVVIFLSILPAIIEFIRERRRSKAPGVLLRTDPEGDGGEGEDK